MAKKKALKPEALSDGAMQLHDTAYGLVVNGSESCARARDTLIAVTLMREQVASVFDPIIAKAHEAHKEALKQKKLVDSRLEEAEEYLRDGIEQFIKAEKEQQARTLAALSAYSNEGGASGAADGSVSDATGDSQAAGIVFGSIESLHNIATRETWTFQITDESLLPREYLKPDEGKIRGVVKALRGSCNIPGVAVSCEEKIVKNW